MSNRDPIRDLCKKSCQVIPIEEKESQKKKYTGYVKRTRFKRIYEGSPYDLKFILAEFDTLEIEFSFVGNPLYYKIYLRELPTYTSLAPYTFNTNRGRLPGLSIFTSYEIDVVAYYVSGQSFHINKREIFTTINEGPPGTITISSPTQLTNYVDNVFFNFEFVNSPGNVIEYLLIVTDLTTDVSFIQYPIANQNNVVYGPSGLTRDTLYNFELNPVYQQNIINIDYTKFASDKTVDQGPVSNIIYSNKTGDSVNINFSHAPGDPDQYSVNISGQGTKILSKDITYVNFTGLSSSTTYDVRINSIYNTIYDNEYSLYTTFTTLSESFVKDISIELFPTNAIISFTPSTGFSTSDTYEVTLTATDIHSLKTFMFDTIQIDISENFEILTENQLYTVDIESIYSSGNKYKISTIFQTLNEGIIDSCIVSNITGASANLSITPFNNSTPTTFDISLVTTGEIQTIRVSSTSLEIVLDNILELNTTYNVSVTAIYDTLNRYTRVDVLSFTTKLESSLPESSIDIIPFGTHCNLMVTIPNNIEFSNLNSTLSYEITNLLSGAKITGDFSSNILYILFDDHGHVLHFNSPHRLKIISSYNDDGLIRNYYTFKDFTTLDEFPLYLNVNNISNVFITGRQLDIGITDTQDIIRTTDYVYYELKLSDGQDFSGNKNIFPIYFVDLKPNIDYSLNIISTFDNNGGNKYTVTYDLKTLNESELEKIEFEPNMSTIDGEYNPRSDTLVFQGNNNPGSNTAVATLFSPSGTIESIFIRLLSGDTILNDYSYNFIDISNIYSSSDVLYKQPFNSVDDHITINSSYIIETTTIYNTGNTYKLSKSFHTRNEKEIDIYNNFYLYTTDDTLALDFIETGTDFTYTLTISGQVQSSQITPPLDYNISFLTVDVSYESYIDVTYNSSMNKYRSNTFTITPGFTTEDFINNGNFKNASNYSERGFFTTLPIDWLYNSESVVISENKVYDQSDLKTRFFKRNIQSDSSFCAVIYKPSINSTRKILKQHIKQNRRPNYDFNDNNIYAGKYNLTYYVANHLNTGFFSFGVPVQNSIAYSIRLINTHPPHTIFEQNFTNSEISYKKIDLSFVINDSYNNVMFEIERTGIENNNLFIMDISLVNMDTTLHLSDQGPGGDAARDAAGDAAGSPSEGYYTGY